MLARIYGVIRSKTPHNEQTMELFVILLSQCSGMGLVINTYTSKINVELAKSPKSYEREAAIYFYYYGTYHSI